MPNTASIRVPVGHIDVANDRVTIHDATFVNHLVKNREKALDVLATAGKSVSLSQLYVDRNGAVVIDSPEFAEAMKKALDSMKSRHGVLDNGACGAGC